MPNHATGLTPEQQQTLESIQDVYRNNHRLRKALREIVDFAARYPGLYILDRVGGIASDALGVPSVSESPEERHHRQLHDGTLNQMPPEHE